MNGVHTRPDGVVPQDVITQAIKALDIARQVRNELGSDEFRTTFRSEDGSLGGRIMWDNIDQQFLVDFSLYWNSLPPAGTP